MGFALIEQHGHHRMLPRWALVQEVRRHRVRTAVHPLLAGTMKVQRDQFVTLSHHRDAVAQIQVDLHGAPGVDHPETGRTVIELDRIEVHWQPLTDVDGTLSFAQHALPVGRLELAPGLRTGRPVVGPVDVAPGALPSRRGGRSSRHSGA